MVTLQKHACLSMILGTGQLQGVVLRKSAVPIVRCRSIVGCTTSLSSSTSLSLKPRHDRTKGWQDIHIWGLLISPLQYSQSAACKDDKAQLKHASWTALSSQPLQHSHKYF